MTETRRNYSFDELKEIPHGHPDYNQFHARHKIGLGSWVRSPLDQRGRVVDVHYGCPESDGWKAGLMVTEAREADENTRWLSVITKDGGSVVYPDFLLTPIAPIPAAEMNNTSYNFYFGYESNDA